MKRRTKTTATTMTSTSPAGIVPCLDERSGLTSVRQPKRWWESGPGTVDPQNWK